MAYNGPRKFANGRFEALIQVCGIVPKCLNCTMLHEKVNPNFDYFDIIGNFNKPSSVMPVGLNNELYPLLNFQYEKINSTLVILSMGTSFFELRVELSLGHVKYQQSTTLRWCKPGFS